VKTNYSSATQRSRAAVLRGADEGFTMMMMPAMAGSRMLG